MGAQPLIDAGRLAAFALASLALAAVPGPAVLYIVSQSVYGGRLAGLVSAAGIASGGVVHVVAAVAGLSALILASAEAFTIVKVTGAAYLVYLGLRTLLRPASDTIGGRTRELGHWRTYRQGVIVNVLNPKTALFFLAFLPQFVDAEHAVRPQLLVLGGIFTTIALASDCLWALAAGSAGAVLQRSRAFLRVQRYVSGLVFIGLGAAAAVTGRNG